MERGAVGQAKGVAAKWVVFEACICREGESPPRKSRYDQA